MKTPSITIVLATCRLGGMDVVFPALKRQTVQTFDVVLVDWWYKARRKALRAYLGQINFPRPVTHLPPPSPRLPAGGGAYNSGFARARGDLVCILSDYSQPPPTYVESHLQTYQAFEGAAALIGPLVKVPPPPLKQELTPATAAISTFSSPWRSHYDVIMRLGGSIPVFTQFPKIEDLGVLPAAALEHGWRSTTWKSFYATQHTSLPRRTLLAINGFDEDYDGGFGGQDLDLGVRATASGLHFVCHENADLLIEVNHHAFPEKLNFPAEADLTPGRNEALLTQRAPDILEGRRSFRAHNNGKNIAN